MNINTIYKRIDRLSNKLKLSVIIDNPANHGVQYDGKGNMYADSPSNAVHEIAHYLVANKKQRTLSNFGLGRSPGDGFSTGYLAPKYDNRGKSEEQASLLGIVIECKFDMDWKKTYRNHNWIDFGHEALELINKLSKKSFPINLSKEFKTISKWIQKRIVI
jgi:hypothetical protein